MANRKGWLKLYRSLLDNYLWQDKPFAKGQAWIDLLLLADHEDSTILYRGGLLKCKRGSVYRSMKYLSERWGWDRRKVDRFLKMLENDGMVSVNSTTHGTTITIVNYGHFQDIGTADGTTDAQQIAQQTVQQARTYKNLKNNKNVKNAAQKFGNFDQRNYTERDYEELEQAALERSEHNG